MFKNFHKIILCLILPSLLSACGGQDGSVKSFSGKLNKKDLIAALDESVFCISVVVESEKTAPNISGHQYSVGTAFLVGEGLLASAFHVQSKADELGNKFKSPYKIVAFKKLTTGETLQFPVELAVFDKENDLSVYRFDTGIWRENPKFSHLKPLVLAENMPSPGEEVVGIGYYGAYEFPFNSIGNVSMIDANEDIISDLTQMPGNSGAPVCDLGTGEVLGLTISVLDLGNETVRFGFAKRAAKIKELLKKL